MHLIGYKHNGLAMVGDLIDGESIAPIATLERFWTDPTGVCMESRPGSARIGVENISLVPPLPPTARTICVGLNYRDHVGEGPFEVPQHPEYFARWMPAMGVSHGEVTVPCHEPGLDWEAELAVVVGREMHRVDAETAVTGVFGYAAFNDITARRAQHRGTQWTLGKNVDESGILGPISPAGEVGDPRSGWAISSQVNGEMVQHSCTDKLIFDVGTLLADLSEVFTLRPGDVLATGTPEGVGHRRTPPRFLRDGDVVTVAVDGLSSIRTTVRESDGTR